MVLQVFPITRAGDKAQLYTRFILEELLPVVKSRFPETESKPKAFAGFSLGALSALDIVWHHPDIFNIAGVFSGSLWWRSMDQELPEYDDQEHRIIHKVIREDVAKPGLSFFNVVIWMKQRIEIITGS
jgi:predicted alpha/beta superfamily hydrolase